MTQYSQLPNLRLVGGAGLQYAYRDTGGEGVPLVLLQHFRGSLDNWDPALVEELGSSRRVIAFDNLGVAGSGGTTPSMIAEMARGALGFLDAMGLEKVDLLGFSIGSFVAQS
jgi:pimeloyl-ACP methyl ester carboxylesterase